MPTAGATAKLPSPPDHDLVRETKLGPVEPMAAAWADQDVELDAEIAALVGNPVSSSGSIMRPLAGWLVAHGG